MKNYNSKLAEKIFIEADQKHAPLKGVISAEINPHTINNKLERHFWFAKGSLVNAYNTYKRQELSQILFVAFGNKYTQKLKDIIHSSSPLILASWGPGDEIRYSRLYDALIRLNASITISCEPRLYELLSQRFPKAKFIKVNRNRIVSDSDLDKYNQLPHKFLHRIMDNYLFSEIEKYDKITILTDISSELIEDFVHSNQYDAVKLPCSKVHTDLIEQVKLLRKKNKMIIGLSWRSSLETLMNRYDHYFNLNELAPLLKLEDMIFVNLQYGNCSEEIMHLQSHCDSEFINLDVDYYNDFLSVYYICQNLDVIVSSGTTVL